MHALVKTYHTTQDHIIIYFNKYQLYRKYNSKLLQTNATPSPTRAEWLWFDFRMQSICRRAHLSNCKTKIYDAQSSKCMRIHSLEPSHCDAYSKLRKKSRKKQFYTNNSRHFPHARTPARQSSRSRAQHLVGTLLLLKYSEQHSATVRIVRTKFN